MHRHWMNFLRNGGYLVIAAIIVAAGIFIPWYLSHTETPPIVYHNVPFPVTNSPITPGEEVALLVDRCVSGNETVSYTFTRSLVPVNNDDNGERRTINLTPSGVEAEPGCAVIESRVNTLPSNLQSGIYKLRAISTMRGRWQTFIVRWESQPFVVVPAG